MILVNIATFVVYVWLLAAMTNWLVGIAGALILLGTAYTAGLINGFLAGFVFGALIWGNLPFEDEHHDDHGHAPAPAADAHSFWDPWGIAFRAVATVAACSFITLLTSLFSDPSMTILGMAHDNAISNALMGVRTAAGCMAALVIFQIATNWGSALPQGSLSAAAAQFAGPAHAPAHAPATAPAAPAAAPAAPAATGTPEGSSGDKPAGPASGGSH